MPQRRSEQVLTERRQRVLAAAIRHHISTAEPVSSEALVAAAPLGVSSATVRNEMASLASMGYLDQPHTSAGRVPTDSGYRFYVNRLLRHLPRPTAREQRIVQEKLVTQRAVEPALETSCRVLATVTRYPSVASAPRLPASRVRYLQLTSVNHRHLLLVLAISTGEVRHSLLLVDRPPSASQLRQLNRLLNERFGGTRREDLTEQALVASTRTLPAWDERLATILRFIADSARGGTTGRLHLRAVLQHSPEGLEATALADLLTILGDEALLLRLISRQRAGRVSVIIGSESEHPAMRNCAVVVAPYWLESTPAGAVGIVGPKRMHYERALAMVGFTARALGESLSRLGMGA
jgi:heat-inducible transcriptional repressor